MSSVFTSKTGIALTFGIGGTALGFGLGTLSDPSSLEATNLGALPPVAASFVPEPNPTDLPEFTITRESVEPEQKSVEEAPAEELSVALLPRSADPCDPAYIERLTAEITAILDSMGCEGPRESLVKALSSVASSPNYLGEEALQRLEVNWDQAASLDGEVWQELKKRMPNLTPVDVKLVESHADSNVDTAHPIQVDEDGTVHVYFSDKDTNDFQRMYEVPEDLRRDFVISQILIRASEGAPIDALSEWFPGLKDQPGK